MKHHKEIRYTKNMSTEYPVDTMEWHLRHSTELITDNPETITQQYKGNIRVDIVVYRIDNGEITAVILASDVELSVAYLILKTRKELATRKKQISELHNHIGRFLL